MYINKGKIMAEQVKGTVLTVLGGSSGLFWCMGLVLFVVSLFDSDPDALPNLAIGMVMCAGSIIVLVLGLQKLKLSRNAKRYGSALALVQLRSIEQLAQNVGQDSRIVKKNMDKMIGLGLIEKITINELENTIIYPRAAFQGPAMTAARCASCGGVTHVPAGSAGVCAYCGSRVQG